ncbi:hypothetical protein EQW76_16490 [Rhizobium sp. rho-13.1]|nr:hypothetical protein EQW76_16490 [Rhizobium sp. rho-13.1]TQY11373.1 hypothetical protein EQW74_17805 [Rhizobium sp. rho-1.1]
MTSWPAIDKMSKARRASLIILSSIGLLLAGVLGFHLAGVVAMILFAPLGALIGLILGSATFRGVAELIGELLKVAFL